MVKDYCYAASFDKKDMPSLYELAERVRTTHNQTLVDNFNIKCQRKADDHNPILEIGNKKIEFEQVSKADDLVVTAGVNQCIDLILGSSTSRWLNMTTGSGTTAPAAAQTNLVTPLFLIDMSLFGWREYASSSLRFAGIFGEKITTHTVNEAGVFSVSNLIMLNRNMFSNNPIIHTVNTSGYVISNVIEFVPVM